MNYVLAVDPGKMTGYAWWQGGSSGGRPEINQADFPTFLGRADRALQGYGPETVVVCEAYIISQDTLRKSRQTWSLEVIGALRYLAGKHGAEFAPLQKAAEAKLIFTDERLRTLGWYERGKEHGRDAARHLGLYLLKNRLISPDEFTS